MKRSISFLGGMTYLPGSQIIHMRGAWRAGSYEGIEHPAKPSAATRSRPRGSSTALLDHLVRPQQHRLRDREPERLGRLGVDDQLEFSRLLHGEVSRLRALQDLVYVGRGAPIQI